MNELEYKNFYETVGKVNGWDFSQVQVSLGEPAWDFGEEVKKRSNKTDMLLDIGTGGGEGLLTISPSILLAVGIDSSSSMVESGQQNLKKSVQRNVRFIEMSAENLQFPEGFFDIVISRHAPFNSVEVAKVLKSDGIFITQQVSEDDKLNIKNAFGRGQSVGENDGALKEIYIKELKKAGFAHVQAYDDNVKEYYQRTEDILFLLQHTQIIPNFGCEKEDFALLKKFIAANQTAKGICTNSKRFLLIARKL
ncbi:class I SAM-dependent methyltransferase [Planococcus sp. CPCC 101016]|uniref:class I SAM-dependent methyltransferase n=1 Tax=Planococcus sp. CPCC 101016 TaxID=2599617 RepID=UPI0011B3EDC1|nr:class I SAM-dependent methyltransferase [Planococcus sp. CPCC 101016]TWT07701.1 class I SAM-dependent methyltransferase [Planococcus sp. CPCC 101016]